MNKRHLYTVQWTQPYATGFQRPYIRGLQEQFEQIVEAALEHSNFEEADEVIKKAMSK